MIATPYLIFLGDAHDALAAKTGQGIVDWRPQWALGQLRLPGCQADLGIPDLDVEAAASAGAKTLVIGTVSPGGVLPESWSGVICAAMHAGLDVASGLHTPLGSVSTIRETAAATGCRLWDVRLSQQTFAVGSGAPRSGKRLLTVGTDCSIGKKYTALALEAAMRDAGMDADFRATGQTGILIAGGGIAIDAVVSDFISGAAEWLTPSAPESHWDVIEGQGSIYHPSFAGVSLGLLHGSQPDVFVVCHEPTRSTMRNVATPMPTVEQVIDLTISHGSTVNAAIRCGGIAINTGQLPEAEAITVLEQYRSRLNLPVCDPMRFGVDDIVAGLIDQP